MKCLGFALLLLATAAHAQVTWRGDLETGNTSQFNALLNATVMNRTYTTVVRDVVAAGQYAARLELHDDARWSNGLRRVEVQHAPTASRTAAGQTLFFAWSFLVPTTLPRTPEQTIGYWETNTSYQQVMAFTLIGSDLRFSTNRPNWTAHWTGAGVVTPNVWHRVAMRVVWSTDPQVGTVDVWFDGVKVVNGVHAATLADTNPTFVQMGLLRGNMNFTDVPVIYLDEALEGSSLASVNGLGLDAGVDAGVTVDAGTTRDAGVVDAGMRADAGLAVDAGAASFDAGLTADAGAMIDAGEFDAGPSPSTDAGSAVDGGTGSGDQPPTGCSTGGGIFTLALLALVARRFTKTHRRA